MVYNSTCLTKVYFDICTDSVLVIDPILLLFLTARKRSYGKVMFLHLSVIQFTGGVCLCTPPGQKPTHPIEITIKSFGTHPTGMDSCLLMCLNYWFTVRFFYQTVMWQHACDQVMKIKEASPQKSTAQTVQSRRSKCVSLYDETPLGKQYFLVIVNVS